MEKIRTEAVTRLGELQKIKQRPFTTMELHPQRQMLGRVQRQEQKRHFQEVEKRKVKLKKDISDIDKYLASVAEYDAYIASMPKSKNDKLSKVISPIVLPAPTIILPVGANSFCSKINFSPGYCSWNSLIL